MARRIDVLATLALGGLGAFAGLAPSPARAADPAASTSCSLSGTAQMPIDLPIYDKADGGSPIAKFTGAETPLVASDFYSGTGKRAKVATSTGSGSFRIEGWVDASKVPVYTKSKVSVTPKHVWLAPEREVSVVGAGTGKLRVKRDVKSPFAQTFTAWADCAALGLTSKPPAGWSPPGDARGYVAKKDVELYSSSEDDRSLVTILTPVESSNGILLWSTEKSGGWVHVVHHSDVIIDAWARTRDLSALPKGETMDQQVAPTSKRNAPQLKLAANPKIVSAPKDVKIRAAASDKGSVIGMIEAGTEVYVLDIVAGWASVVPKKLNVMPHGSDSFWARATELGVSP